MIHNQVIQTTFQAWLESQPHFDTPEKRKRVKELHIYPQSYSERDYHRKAYQNTPNVFYIPDQQTFESPLILELLEFTELESLTIVGQKLITLNLSSNFCLKSLHVPNNSLKCIVWPDFESNHRIPLFEEITLANNNLPTRDLSVFGNFSNLKTLLIGTDDPERIKQGKYNRWYGSLEDIKNLNNLRDLDINATNLWGPEYLPFSNLQHFTFGKMGRKNARISAIQNALNAIEINGSTRYICSDNESLDEWAALGTKASDDFEKMEEKISLIRKWGRQQVLKQSQQSDIQTQIEMPKK